MTTDDLGQNNPSGLPVPQDDELQDTLLGQPQGGELELDPYGVPAQDRPAQDRIYLAVTASSICAVISAWVLIVAHASHSYYKVPAWQVWLGAGSGLLAASLAALTLKRAERKKQQLGVAVRITLRALAVVGFLGFVAMMGVLQGPLCSTC